MAQTQYITVKNKAHLDALQIHNHGEVAYCEDTKELWVYDENEEAWMKFQVDNKGIDLNLYDLNKSVISQLTPMTSNEISMKIGMITDYYNNTQNHFHMLLCRDYNYYTIFADDTMLSFPDFASAVCTIITELGDIYSIEETGDGALEIWIKPTGEESPYAFYLFPYDAGVVYYG